MISTIHVLTSILLTLTPHAQARVTNRPANPLGKVLILEYHNITTVEKRWDRSTKRFAADLDRLYRLGFRPVTMTEYLSNKMKLPPGASPVVFTFDDSSATQFKMRKDGTIAPDCAVGIWLEFEKTHPDFPLKATWYVMPDVMFMQKEWIAKKVEMILKWGGELANHTITHPRLNTLSDAKVEAEFGKCTDRIAKMGAREPIHLALPFGILPKNKALLKSYTYGGKKYTFASVVLAGAGPALAPTDPKLNPYRLPRVQGIDLPYGITYWLDRMKSGEVKPYVAP